jgi:heptaprenyl diphosphate synthase
MVRLALLVAAGLILFVFESFIPRPLPWLRLGLANVATVLALYLYGVREAFVVAIARAVLGSLSVGGFLTPTFLFSLIGGLMSVATMAIIFRLLRRIFSVVGVSVWGAFAHNMSQLALAIALFVRRWELVHLLPLLLLATVVTGCFTGMVVSFILQRVHST